MKYIIIAITVLFCSMVRKDRRVELIGLNEIPTVSVSSKLMIGVIDVNSINWNSHRSLYKSQYQFQNESVDRFSNHGQAVVDQLIATLESQNEKAFEKVEIIYCQVGESMVISECLSRFNQIPNLSLVNISMVISPEMVRDEEILEFIKLSEKAKITISSGNFGYKVEDSQALCQIASKNVYCVGGVSDYNPALLDERSNHGALINAYAPFKGSVLLEGKEGQVLFQGTSAAAPTFMGYIVNKSLQLKIAKNN